MVLEAVGRIDRCVLLSLRTPAEAVERLVPRPLELVTVEASGERWAFWNVVACHIERMRPAGVPAAFGLSYHHVAYRLLVRAPTPTRTPTRPTPTAGWLDGLYFTRSDVDSRPVAWGGAMVSDFRFHAARVRMEARDERWVVIVEGEAPLRLEIDPRGEAGLAEGSVFGSVEEARRVLKYRPVSMAPARVGRVGVGRDGRMLRLAEVVRDESAWRERAVRVLRAEFGGDTGGTPLPLRNGGGATVELCTLVEPIDYRWRLGRRVVLGPTAEERAR